jgi:pyruvate ferredoxin oxidoreductase gamma subunit
MLSLSTHGEWLFSSLLDELVRFASALAYDWLLAPSQRVRMPAEIFSMLRHMRFHGRGGEGVKLASHVVSRAAFLAGFTVQDSPLYGAERRGAPVVAFARIADEPIHERGYIDQPDAIVLMDHSLLELPEAAVLDGASEQTLVLANSAQPSDELKQTANIPGRVITLDVSSIALHRLHHHLLSAPIAGFTVKVAALAPWETLAEAARIELTGIGLNRDVVELNLAATREAFDAAPAVGLSAPVATPPPVPGARFVIPRLPARLAAPSISATGTSALRSMAGWRVYRPEIELSRCTRCFICFALCPEGAIRLDAESYPVVDYDHCKGCLVCATECPPHAITEVRETAA